MTTKEQLTRLENCMAHFEGIECWCGTTTPRCEPGRCEALHFQDDLRAAIMDVCNLIAARETLERAILATPPQLG